MAAATEQGMTMDLLDLYRAGDWCGEKVSGATTMDADTPCDGGASATC